MSTDDTAWRKSSYSGNNDVGNCVEVASLTASFGIGRKSSYSGNDDVGSCVEVATSATSFSVRDSKDVQRGHLKVSPAAWGELLRSLRNR